MKRFFSFALVLVMLIGAFLPVFAAGVETDVDAPENHGRFIVTLTDENGDPMPRVTYNIFKDYESAWRKQVDSMTTDESGKAMSNYLPYGEYTIIEHLPTPEVYIYLGNDSLLSRLDSAKPVEIHLTAEPYYGSLNITLKNEEGNPIPSAEISLYKHDGSWNLFDTLTTDANGVAYRGELKTAYYATIVRSATGFYIDRAQYMFEVKALNLDTEQEITMERIAGNMKVIKSNHSGDPLPGVRYGIYDGQNQLLEELITGPDGTATSATLLYGSYELRELTPAEGQAPMPDAIPFDISVHGETVEIPISSELLTGRVRVINTDTDGEPISGAIFGIYDSGDNITGELYTGSDGTAMSGNLPKGDYYLLESGAIQGYAPNTEPIPFSITAHGEVVEKTIVSSEGYGTLRVSATGDNAPLPGTVFKVYRVSDGSEASEITTGADGTAEISLPVGDYYLIQTQAVSGFKLPDGSFPFSLEKHGKICELNIQNELIPVPQTGNIRVITMSEVTGTRLQGARFGIYESETDTLADTVTTGNDGTATSAALPGGAFYLRELTAPTGFTPITAKIDATVTAGATSEIYVYYAPIPQKGRIRLTKREEATEKPLSNVVFGLYDAATHIKIEELITGEDGTALSGELDAGVYYLLELRGLTGYKVSTEKTGITVTPGKTAEITLYNTPIQPPDPEDTTGYIRLNKRADKTNAPLQGAVFFIYTASGNIKVAELTTDAQGKAMSGEIPVGDYYLLEQIPPAGYSAITDKIGVTVKAGEIANITVFNSLRPPPQPTSGYIQLIARAEETDATLKSAVFGVYSVSGDIKMSQLTTDTRGKVISEELPEGAYYLLEEKPPSGYSAVKDKIGVTVKAGETADITVYYSLAPVTKETVRVTTREAGTGKWLSGAAFGIYDAVTKAKVAGMTTGADGSAVQELPEKNYYLRQLKAPAGFKPEAAEIPFSVKADKTVEIEITNMASDSGVRLTVKDSDGPALAGAVVAIYDKDDKKITELTTGKDGTAFYGLPYGAYHIIERSLPSGYTASAKKYSFTVTPGQTADVIIIKQKDTPPPTFEIPKTGEAFPWLNYAAAALCMLMSIVLCVYAVCERGVRPSCARNRA